LQRKSRGGRWLVLFACLCLPVPATAAVASLQLRVDDGAAPVADAVASLHAKATTAAGDARAVMDQRDTAFVPGVLPVQAGTSVSFPNSDSVQHQVYSFSAAKPFELPLYAGTPLQPVRFDTPGVVVVGCNIHDWMIGHIVVLDTPYFGKTDAAGRASLQAPPGAYRLRIWHPRLGAPVERDVSLAAGGTEQALTLALGPPPQERRGSERLRALQEKLRSLKREP
jgi:plastocyanin